MWWWRHRGTAAPEVRQRPTDEALRDALRLNDDHVRGLTRLDQELVYVPLATLAAALFAVVSATSRPHLDGARILAVAFAIVLGVVLFGLRRNQERHERLYEYRRQLVGLLELPPLPERPDLARGRQIYGTLFAIGWTVGAALLLSLLTSQ